MEAPITLGIGTLFALAGALLQLGYFMASVRDLRTRVQNLEDEKCSEKIAEIKGQLSHD